MTLQKAIDQVALGAASRAEAAKEKARLDSEEANRQKAQEEKLKREFVASYLPRMVDMLGKRIEVAAWCNEPSAKIRIVDIEPRGLNALPDHEGALLAALATHYKAVGFVTRISDQGSVDVSGWLESPCG